MQTCTSAHVLILGQQARYAAPHRRHGSGLNFLFCLDWAGGVFAGWALLCLWIGLLPHVVFVAVRETGERRFQEPRRASSARARVARGAAERCRPSPSRAHSIKSICMCERPSFPRGGVLKWAELFVRAARQRRPGPRF